MTGQDRRPQWDPDGEIDSGENDTSNDTANRTIGDVIAERFSRRDVLRGALGTTAIAAVFSPMDMVVRDAAASTTSTPSFNFKELAAGFGENHFVAEGHDADVLIRWGDAVIGGAPEFDPHGQTADAQARQFGYNNDFIGYLPIDGRSDHGLLVINHEFTNETLIFPGRDHLDQDPRFADIPARQVRRANHKARLASIPDDYVRIEMMAHGGSVLEVQRRGGKWSVVPDSQYARRITAETEMRFSGPAASHPLMKTSDDPDGTTVRGMLNNCAGAITPWGTWLTCEENFNGYFWGRGSRDEHPQAAALKRYGAPAQWYAWGRYHDRFDIAKEPNEPHRFGWVVEIDPWDPQSVPVKRTALGRFKHEGAGNIVNRDGRFVVYQGDDQRFDYVYKFVTDEKVNMTDRAANASLLDSGTLHVARFNNDGSGEWMPLRHGEGPLTEANGFSSQGDVVIFARLAADLLGATKMDRPEDIDANPKTNKVYVMLTNNTRRKPDQVDAANPRARNAFGHVIEIVPSDGDHAATSFAWEILVRCGDPAVAEVGATFNPATTRNGWFAKPDNCVVDADGRLWIATDGNSPSDTGRNDGLWAMETEGVARGTSKLFFRCPNGAELCGPEFTPDLETLFVAVQHPGVAVVDGRIATFENPSTRWPDFEPAVPPRPSIVAITKAGGGKIAI